MRRWRGMGRRAARALAWAAAAVATGLACGGAAVALSLVCGLAEAADRAVWLLPLCLPLCSLATSWAYHALGVSADISTASVFARQRDGGPIRAQLAPAILAGTALTLLGGGSVGKEAAALQLGGAIGAQVERLGRARGGGAARGRAARAARTLLAELAEARGTFVLAGMAAAFSALMFAPAAATVLVLEVARPPRARLLRWRTLCVPVAAVAAGRLAGACGVGRVWQAGTPAGDASALAAGASPLALAALVACSTAVGVAFVWAVKECRRLSSRAIPAPWARALAGSALAAALALALGRAYAGTGAAQIALALAGAGLPADAFARKAALTVACLGFGLKGGEVMPALSIGACLGQAAGAALGCDPALFAALGLVAVFSACTLCPLAALALGLEAFGASALGLLVPAALLPGLSAAALDMARLCRSRADARAYLEDASGLAGRAGKFSLGLFVR